MLSSRRRERCTRSGSQPSALIWSMRPRVLWLRARSDVVTQPRLTSLSHGGGCGCKIAPGVLAEILKGVSAMPMPKELLVGIETSDDAAVYQLNAEQALIATTDFFMPIVDDPFDFGRIAATNAISDVYAMGGSPIMALALVGMPIDVLSTETIGKSSRGVRQPAARPAFPLRVDTRSIQWSRFTA